MTICDRIPLSSTSSCHPNFDWQSCIHDHVRFRNPANKETKRIHKPGRATHSCSCSILIDIPAAKGSLRTGVRFFTVEGSEVTSPKAECLARWSRNNKIEFSENETEHGRLTDWLIDSIHILKFSNLSRAKPERTCRPALDHAMKHSNSRWGYLPRGSAN